MLQEDKRITSDNNSYYGSRDNLKDHLSSGAGIMPESPKINASRFGSDRQTNTTFDFISVNKHPEKTLHRGRATSKNSFSEALETPVEIKRSEKKAHDGQAISENRMGNDNKTPRNYPAVITTFLILFFIWILLSGRFDAFHIGLGVLSSGVTAYFTSDLLFPEFNLKTLPGVWFRFIRYIPWLLYQVLIANLQMMYLVFHPKMEDLIDPRIIRFKSDLKNSYAVVTFANSITLTPGTITVNVSIYGSFSVHCINKESGGALPGEMEDKVRKVFGE